MSSSRRIAVVSCWRRESPCSRRPSTRQPPASTDLAQVRAESEAARRLGFGGKLCIHPDQVAIVNESFLPSVVEVEWARKVVAAAHAAGGAAVAVDGRMVDRPVIDLAERILAQSRGTEGTRSETGLSRCRHRTT